MFLKIAKLQRFSNLVVIMAAIARDRHLALDILANGSCKCFFVCPYLFLARDITTAEVLKRTDDKLI